MQKFIKSTHELFKTNDYLLHLACLRMQYIPLWDFALNVTICKSLHFALLHLDILLDYIINCITHETCKVNCARLCTIEHMLHIQVWKILQFAVFVAPKLLNLFFKKHGLAHENVQVIAYCIFWICNCAIYCTTFWKFILHFINIPMCKILHFAVQYFKSAHPHIICKYKINSYFMW